MKPEQIKRINDRYGRAIQLRAPLKDGDIFVLDNPAVTPVYLNVIFVVDHVDGPFSKIVGFALNEAERCKSATVTLPTSRTAWSAKKLSREDPIAEIVRALENLELRGHRYLQRIRVMFNNDLSGPSKIDRLRGNSAKIGTSTTE